MRSFWEFVFFLGSTSAFQGSRLALNILAAAVLPLAGYGFWGLATVVLTYTTYTNAGILSAANRTIPILLGQGRPEEATRIESVSRVGSAVLGGAAGVLAFLVCIFLGAPWNIVALPLAFAIFMQQVHLFYQVSLRARMDFGKASAQQLFLAVTLILIGVPLLLLAGVPGLVWAYAVVYLFGSLVVHFLWRRTIPGGFAPAEVVSLVRPGLPIMLAGLLFGLLVTADRWITLSFLGEEALGQYTLAGTVSASLLLVFTVLAQQFYPRIGHEVGRSGNGAAILRLAHRHGLLSALAVAPFSLGLILLAPILVNALLPRYDASVRPLQVLAVGFIVLAFSNGYTNMLVAIGRYWLLLIIHGIALAVVVVAGVVAVTLHLGLTGIAGATAIGFAFLTAAAVSVASFSLRPQSAR